MKRLSQKDLKVIEKICGEEYARRLQALQEKQTEKLVKIVNTGMVSSGKSSLYNLLIQSEDEFFPTGAARTTTRANYFDYNHISYIDTPGIDVRSEDDAMAFNTIIAGDIIMMIHNIRTGPLGRSEVEWLERIVQNMGSTEMCQSRMLFIISWKDTREHDDDYADLVQELKQQVFDITGTEIPVFEISSKKYQQGMQKNKQGLIDSSGVVDLKRYLEDYAEKYIEKKKCIDAQEYHLLVEETQKLLMNERKSKDSELTKIVNRTQAEAKPKRTAWEGVYEFFSIQRRKLSEMIEELNNE
jgi:tRNA U34 5-carboxymethylaminomethyl modifying GTPase MnmE/TrmE